MLRVWIVRVPLLPLLTTGASSSAIVLLYLAILRSGAQSVIVNRDTWRSNNSD